MLLWCDPSNYGGIKSKMPAAGDEEEREPERQSSEDKGEEADGELDDADDSPEMEMNWNLATYLPEEGACQRNFNTVVAGT
jgi:DNA polymerase epsilon subunit 1